MKTMGVVAGALLLTGVSGLAQSGDKAGEEQKPLVPRKLIPPAPVLKPEQALKSFKLQRGFRIELIAAEPLVQDPVEIEFDADGRLWVVEMSGYMPDIAGRGETNPVGKIVVLEDTDGDGRMDRRTVFLDGLVMPRALCLVRDGVIVAEPPRLWFCRDTDGDGKCDERIELARDYAKESDYATLGLRANPEHAANGLLHALDNWIYSANFTTRYRFDGESLQKQPTMYRGQWGISQDNYGRLAYNSNSDQLRLDLAPAEYLLRNPYYRGAVGANWRPVTDQSVWPARVNPGVNRGYRPGQLRAGEWTLATYTAASGPVIYRGDQFPPECVGDAFIPEPAGNLVRRNKLTEHNGFITARNAYDRAEFLASTDERFRPVNLANGPDGALYIVDFYRGLIQHRIYLTSYLRQQTLSRGLERPINLGRIYRVVAEGRPRRPAPKLGKAPPDELVKALSHPNGWVRDTAQRLLVERNATASIAPLKQLAVSGANHLGRLHALWTLDGLGQLDADTVRAVLDAEKHSKLRAAAIRLSEPHLRTDAKDELLARLTALTSEKPLDVQLQLAFTLGQVTDPAAEAAMARIALNQPTNALVRDALISGLAGRELEMAARVLTDPAWRKERTGADQFLAGLARCVVTQGRGERVNRLLELAAGKGAAAWQTAALLEGMTAGAPGGGKGKPPARTKLIRLPAEPPALAALRKISDRTVKSDLAKLDKILVWPGKPGAPPEPEVRPLTPDQQARFELGKVLYEFTCGACHQPHGFGQDGLAPPLADSEWVARSDAVLTRIVLHGLRGPITVQGRKWDLDMPGFGMLDDEQVAALLTYIRREWDHTYDPVEPSAVAKVRAATARREDAWTEEELKKVK